MAKLQWSYGLPQFLEHSNEDAVCSLFIGNLAASAFRRLRSESAQPIRIADLGCGQASKAALVAEFLHERGIATNWDLIDIDGRWKAAIFKNLARVSNANRMHFNVLCPVAADTWLHLPPAVPHIALFIHVPYDDESEEMVYRVTRALVSLGSFVLISTEHPSSGLSLLRRRMTDLGYNNLPSERTTSLETRLRNDGLVVKSYVLRHKYLDIGSIDQLVEVDWFWDLLSGDKHNINDKVELLDLIRQVSFSKYRRGRATISLHIPDLVITVRERM